jgi:ParB family chromosome partitioning protein
MGKNLHGAEGRGDVLNFRPEVLKVITDPKHPQYDLRVTRKPDEAMILSIMRLGVIEPLVIAPDGNGAYVVDGRQRRAAAIEANKRLISEGSEPLLVPCVWRRGDDAKLFEIMVAANEVRSGDSPVERAKKMQHLKDMGRDDDQVAAVFGCSKPTVKNTLALLACAPDVVRAVEAGEVYANVASKLAKLTREKQVETLAEMKAAGATKGNAAQKAVQAKHEDQDVQPASRMRSRKFLERFLAEPEKDENGCATAVVAFVLGDDGAIGRWPFLMWAADAAGRKKRGEAEVGNTDLLEPQTTNANAADETPTANGEAT